ncbi:MAG: hypothetical protein A2586_00385 [Candidatus Harrisonbacteria bacterium RIFOXYD1_FULL_40_9]|uniref:DoxX family protein n=1 Tax=Candidatus Harrisonbacteria bacterium RIFOXYD1_FULL_40_9 TaxID=1798412 RepID=A0A1G1ZYF7_9BACT|nr:MAG: hypothetical protein A2586_00385 [Candidatus Harrisonbacteria bacterium RIFOXYD1_FULL_40_9]
MNTYVRHASWLLRIGLSFVFLYAGISSLNDASNWVGFFPRFMQDGLLIATNTWMLLFAMYEITLGVWLIISWKTSHAALCAFLTLCGILVFNLDQMLIVFRDVTIAFSALALVLISKAYE